ncbi:MAG: KpsF/GutQ family sugar-phosphate isomerase [Alphaproteobacteria bacterium]|nr:MAG: KpsF/GutQ family sugar-phosphate isomerase [Alphaproteobacteria bacterium]
MTSAAGNLLENNLLPTREPQGLPTIHAHIAEGRRVISLEAKALTELSHTLDVSFGEAVEAVSTITGRIIVTGVGKSGLIGAKIAATLSSTGMPALFVHAGDASHGDLGMITPNDAILALSNSGETSELVHVINYAKRFGILLIAITQNPQSTLAKAAHYCLLLPQTPEACGLGVAPTTSSTATLALGDALAVALLTKRGFSVNDFGVFHPGGSLGRLLVRVDALMHKGEQLPVCHKDTPLSEALITMTRKRLGCVGVLDDEGRLIGIITDGDLRRHMSKDLPTHPAHKVMTPSPKVAHPKQLANEVLLTLNKYKITNIFVVDSTTYKPLGVLHIHDFLGQSRK